MITEFPKQAIPRNKKNKEWREKCVKFAENHTVSTSSMIRKSVAHKKINYDLYNGKIDMADLEAIINPNGVELGVPTEKIQHYPVINDKIMLLLGEERSAQWDFKVVVTNPEAISEIEESKKKEIHQKIQELIQQENLPEEEMQAKAQEMQNYFNYKWQDFREIRANCLLNHYKKEQNFDSIFNAGFADALICHEEIYQCTIEGGEPVLKKINPMKITILGGGSSNRVEDANMIILEDYLDLNTIIDRYGEYLTIKDIKKLEELNYNEEDEWGDKGDPRKYFRFGDFDDQVMDFKDGYLSFKDGISSSDLPYDMYGNLRVLQVYWKSIRKVLKVKSYDQETGDTYYHIETEDYIVDEDNGEESEVFYINEPWHGTMIGGGTNAIFVNVKECEIPYRRMSNPSKCHFGFVGTIYNINEGKSMSLVDMMKPLQYEYDVVHNRLNQTLARNVGKVIQLNLSMIPEKWTVDKWLHFVKTSGIAVVDPMKEGAVGIAKGKMAGMYNVPPVIDAELGQSIQFMIQYLEYIQNSMYEMTGLSKQRMGQIANRETVGGVERATLQSAHSTRWYFSNHDDLKKRVCECFLETAKACLKGDKYKDSSTKKFSYILPDHSTKLIEINGDEFAECDYGLVVDDGYDMQTMTQEIQQIAQAAMQNQMLSFSAYLKIRSNCSMAEKVRIIESEEQRVQQMQQQQMQQQQQLQQQQIQAQQEMEQQKAQMEAQEKQAELQLKDTINQRDNQTKMMIASMQVANNTDGSDGGVDIDVAKLDLDKEKLEESMREFQEQMNIEDRRIELDRQKLAWEKQKNDDNNKVKLEIAKMKPKTTNNN